MEYKELLQTDEWKVKCSDILQRDNYVCQDCGCVGIHSNTFFPISCINDINKFLPNSLFNEKDLFTICNNIEWSDKIIPPISFNSKFFKEQLYIYTMDVHCMENEFIFAADTRCSEIHFVKCINDVMLLSYNGKEVKGRLFAFKFLEDLGRTNYASVSYYISGNTCNLEELKISVFFENKCFFFDFTYLHYINDAMLFKLTPLNIHHNYYMLGKRPWEYNNNALITLCSQCHQKRHLRKNTPIFTLEDKCINLPLCDRCQGTGYLPQYHYCMGGVCFKCHGEGVFGYDM